MADITTKLTDEQVAEVIERTDFAGAIWHDRSEVAPIAAAVRTRAAAEASVTAAVLDVRAHGVTWIAIASALGVSHQAAMKKYKPLAA
ncbi:MAG: hypothetical protein FWF28_03095 [Micrococcales bacterium]|nr:hypothetical protein [Micrococcales bacterium]